MDLEELVLWLVQDVVMAALYYVEVVFVDGWNTMKNSKSGGFPASWWLLFYCALRLSLPL